MGCTGSNLKTGEQKAGEDSGAGQTSGDKVKEGPAAESSNMGCRASKDAVVEGATPELTADIKTRVRDTWAAFLKVNDESQRDYGFYIFLKLFELSPEAKGLFEFLEGTTEEDLASNAKLGWHVKRVTDAISALISNLDHVDVVIRMLENLGGRHVGYGVKEEYFESIQEGVLHSLEQALKERFTEEDKSAWRLVLALVSHFMIQGMKKKGIEDKSTVL